MRYAVCDQNKSIAPISLGMSCMVERVVMCMVCVVERVYMCAVCVMCIK